MSFGNKQSRLRVVVVEGTKGSCALVFACVTHGGQPNTVRFMVRKSLYQCSTTLSTVDGKLALEEGYWWHQNVMQKVQGKFGICMFSIHLSICLPVQRLQSC
jgi:hypothetical protein